MKVKHLLTAAALSAAMTVGTVNAETTIRVQSVLGDSSDEVVMLKEFAKDVGELTGGSLTIEVLPAGAVAACANNYGTHEHDMSARHAGCRLSTANCG